MRKSRSAEQRAICAGALSGSVSLGQGGWRRLGGTSMRPPMIRFAAVLMTVALASPTLAASDLSVLPQGRYGCWTAGIASGPAVVDEPSKSFTIVRGSSYQSEAGGGTYLLASDILTFTRGPFKDMRLRRTREGFWQQIARDGELGRLKCSRRGAVPLA